jgi:hypothetical protein
MNACLENVGRTAMSRAFLLAIVGCFACGSNEVRKERALSPEVARLGMALTTDTPSDPFVKPVMDALSRHFVDAGYLIVQRDARQAQVVGTISVTSRLEESILRITVNGQQSISYDVTVQFTIVGRDREIIDQLQEGFSAKYGRADDDAARKIVWQVRAHRKLDAYSKKIARADTERMKQAAREVHALPAAAVPPAHPDADNLVDQMRSGGNDFAANKLEVALRALEKGDLRTFREIREAYICPFSRNDAACKFLQGLDLPKETSSAPGAERMKQDAREREMNRQRETAASPPTSSLSTAFEPIRPAKTPAWLQKAGGKGDGGLDKESRLAVLEFSGPLEATVLMVLSDEVRGVALKAVAEHHCSVMTRESMAVILRDMGRGECEEGDCDVDTGRSIGADLVVSGSVAEIEGTFVATLKLHETARGDLLAIVQTKSVRNKLELREVIERSSVELFK